jgi:DNA-binding transcriptional regulator YiaG
MEEFITSYPSISIEEIPTGEQIRRLRRRMHLTQQEFADLLWVTKLTITRWETSSRICKGPALRLLNILEKFQLWDKIV